MSGYPADWPKCVYCGDDALDGHLTCGRVDCSEAQARDDRRDLTKDEYNHSGCQSSCILRGDKECRW